MPDERGKSATGDLEPASARAEEPDSSASPPSGADLFIPKRRLWPVFAVLLAVAGAVAFSVFRFLTEPLPLRVLIAIDLGGYPWEGSEPAAALVDRLSKRLGDLGFDPVKLGDPAVMKVLEKAKSPAEAGKKLRAAFLVTARLAPHVEEHPIQGGYVELRVVEAELAVTHAGGGATERAALNGFAGAPTRDEGMRLLARTMADQTFDAVLPAIIKHPTIGPRVAGDAGAKAADALAPAKTYVDARRVRLADAEVAYAKLDKTRSELEKGPVKVTYQSAFSSLEALAGTSSRGTLVQTANIRPFFSPDAQALGWITALETLEWRNGGAPPKRLWSGYHIYEYAAAAPDGETVLLVEDLFGAAKTLTVIDASGKARRVRVDDKRRFIDPKVAPGGKAAALYDRACRGCPGGFLVVSLEDGGELFRVEPDARIVLGFSWLDARRVFYLRADENGVVENWVADLTEKPARLSKVFKAPHSERYSDPVASPDGRMVALAVRGKGTESLAVLDIAKAELVYFDVAGDAEYPAFSPDGQRIVMTLWQKGVRNNEIALVDRTTRELRVLTKNPFREANPQFSADGATIYFESRDVDPNFPRSRVVSVIGSLPVAP